MVYFVCVHILQKIYSIYTGLSLEFKCAPEEKLYSGVSWKYNYAFKCAFRKQRSKNYVLKGYSLLCVDNQHMYSTIKLQPTQEELSWVVRVGYLQVLIYMQQL